MSPRILVLASAALAFASAAQAADRNYTVTQFTKIRIDGGYKVKLATGVSPFAIRYVNAESSGTGKATSQNSGMLRTE